MTAMISRDRVVTKCDHCGQWDDHPKVHVGWHTSSGLSSTRHHDCIDQATKLDILAGTHSQHPLLVAKILSECEQGLKGGDLLAFIGAQQMADYGDAEMATTGIDQTMANAILTALTPTSATATIGTVTVTAPIKCRFDSVMTTTDSGASTEWTTSGGYTAGGVSIGSNWAAASAGSRATNGAVTVSNAPAQTWAGNELWDSSGTPLRGMWGVITGGSKTVNSGDTCTIASGSLTVGLT